MILRKALVIAGAFAAGFLVSEFASIRAAHAQPTLEVSIRSCDPHYNKPFDLKGSKWSASLALTERVMSQRNDRH
jgi:hypothetical protein